MSFLRRLLVAVIFIIGLAPVLWYRPNFIIAVGDEFPYINPVLNFPKSVFLWISQNGGKPSSSGALLLWTGLHFILGKIGLSDDIIQISIMTASFLLGGISMFFLSSLIFKKDVIASFSASVFYMFNMIHLLGISNVVVSWFFFLLPLSITFLIKAMQATWDKRNRLKSIFLFALSSMGLFSFSVLNPPFILLAILSFLVVIIYCLMINEKLQAKSLIKELLGLLIIVFLVNIWWIVPLFTFFPLHTKGTISINAVVDVSKWIWTHSRSSFLNLLWLNGFWGWKPEYFSYSIVYSHPFFRFIVFVPMFLVLFGLLIKEKSFNRNSVSYLYYSVIILLLLFLTKGLHSPFSNINLFLYNHIPGFWVFRESWKFCSIIPIFFSLLIGYSCSLISHKVLRRESKFKRGIWNWLLLSVIIFPFLIICFPFFTGEAIERSSNFSAYIKIPSYWYNLSNYVNQKREEFRILIMPPATSYVETYDWGYFGAGNLPVRFISKPSLQREHGYVSNYAYQSIINYVYEKDEFAITCNLLSLLNGKYILQRNDVIQSSNKDDLVYLSNATLWPYNFVKLEGSFEKLELFRVSDQCFLPRFYIPQSITYSSNDIEALPEIVGLPEYQIKSAIYLNNINELTDSKIDELKNEEYFEKLEIFEKGVPFSYVRWKPGSWEWRLTGLKEKYEEWKVRKNEEKLIDKKLFYATKRISEFEKFGEVNGLADLILMNYENKMNEAIEEVKKLKDREIGKFDEQVIKIRAYWERHKEKIDELTDLKINELKDWEKVFGELDEEIKGLEEKFDLENLEYSLEIPKNGEYKVYLEIPNSKFPRLKRWGRQIPNLKLQIDGEGAGDELITTDENWLEAGEINLEEGKHKTTLKLPEPENLIGGDWQKLEEEAMESGEIKPVSQEFFPEGKIVIFQSIKNWEPGGLYYLSFEYKTRGGSLGMGVLEDKLVINEINELTDCERKTEKILEKRLRSVGEEEWEKFERVLRADKNAEGAKIYFYTLPKSNTFTDVGFRNVKVYRLIQPKIVLRAVGNNTGGSRVIPRITFVKINPTKYRIKVEGAKEPYTLVFSESFHKGWKLYMSDQRPATSDQQYGEVVASYFDGEIKEGTHRNTFLEKATFETWGKKPIAEDRHYLVNGYANSWYITPEDVGGREDYELIVEFWPQRLFYVGLFISGLTLVGCLSYLIFDFAKGKLVKNEN